MGEMNFTCRLIWGLEHIHGIIHDCVTLVCFVITRIVITVMILFDFFHKYIRFSDVHQFKATISKHLKNHRAKTWTNFFTNRGTNFSGKVDAYPGWHETQKFTTSVRSSIIGRQARLGWWKKIIKCTTLRILAPSNGGVWTCIAGVRVLKIGTFEGSGYLGQLRSGLWWWVYGDGFKDAAVIYGFTGPPDFLLCSKIGCNKKPSPLAVWRKVLCLSFEENDSGHGRISNPNGFRFEFEPPSTEIHGTN